MGCSVAWQWRLREGILWLSDRKRRIDLHCLNMDRDGVECSCNKTKKPSVADVTMGQGFSPSRCGIQTLDTYPSFS